MANISTTDSYNLNLPQTPDFDNREVNDFLTPLYLAIWTLNSRVSGDVKTITSVSESNAADLKALSDSISGLATSLSVLSAQLTQLTSRNQVFARAGLPDINIGSTEDIWIVTSDVRKPVYRKYGGSLGWQIIGYLAASSVEASANYLVYKGTYATGITYPAYSVVSKDGAVWMALVVTSTAPASGNSSWQLLEGTGVALEAVLSSRNPALPGDPPNFVISRDGDLVYKSH